MAIKRLSQDQGSSSQPSSGKKRKSRRKRGNSKTETTVEEQLLLATATQEETDSNEDNIRPHRLADYIGQKDLKGVLEIAIAAAKGRKDPLDHLLLYGPPQD